MSTMSISRQNKRAAVRAIPTVTAGNMIYAQGWKPTPEQRAAIVALADMYEVDGFDRRVSVKVHDFGGALIGTLEFNI